MTERRTIQVSIHKWEDFYIPPETFLRQLEDLVKTIPVEFQQHAILELDPYAHADDDDSTRCGLLLFYRRDETDEEVAARARSETSRKSADEARERKILAALKAKYERGAS